MSSPPARWFTSLTPSAPAAQATTAPAAPGATPDATLTVAGFKFSALTVAAGTKVTAKNQDSAAHTVTVGGTKLDVNVTGGGTATFTAPDKAGTYPLTCDFQGNMKGALVVTG